ncbi:MAG: hypothetical protein EA392_11630 [Cryomorphaceae bacterium]|nr:MAG: hypothetical protein EA392_11630 [Cryomorphaceae bacterium]
MGLKDHYVAAVKGSIYCSLPDARIVDITHQIDPFDLQQTAFIVRNAFRHFPKKSVHIIGVKPEIDLGEDLMHVLVEYDGHFFLGADNGIFSLIFDRHPDRIFELELSQDIDDMTFPTRDVFVKAACHLARGGTPEVIGRQRQQLRKLSALQPIANGNTIRGSIIYIDRYGNAVSNISKSFFRDTLKSRPFELYISGGNRAPLREISYAYNNVSPGDAVALFNSGGQLEIAINGGSETTGGSARSLLGLRIGHPIRIEIK